MSDDLQAIVRGLSERVAVDSDDYDHTFYGILNKQGQFWTPLPFHDEEAARAHLSRWAKGDYVSMLTTHKIVPVRIRLETIPDAPEPRSPSHKDTEHGA